MDRLCRVCKEFLGKVFDIEWCWAVGVGDGDTDPVTNKGFVVGEIVTLFLIIQMRAGFVGVD